MDQGSIYSALQDVPTMLSPQYKLPRQINIASELVPMPDPALVMVPYPFAIEKDALADIAAAREAQQKESERLDALRKAYQEEKIRKQKLAARKIAPGFLDTDTRILKPEQLHSNKTAAQEQQSQEEQQQQEQQRDENQQPLQQQQQETSSATDDTATNSFDYLKFEQGLAPPDPWDQPENDLTALGWILGHPRPDNVSPSQIAASHPYPNAHKRASSPQYTGGEAYRPPAYNGNATRPPPQQKHVYPPHHPATRHSSPPVAPAPALPPKPFTETGSSPSPTHTSPRIVAASVLPGSPSTPPNPAAAVAAGASPSLAHSLPTIPPPLPPHPTPHQSHEHLIDELVNMGFSRHQAAEALEKNDYDLTKATNFLLDHGVD